MKGARGWSASFIPHSTPSLSTATAAVRAGCSGVWDSHPQVMLWPEYVGRGTGGSATHPRCCGGPSGGLAVPLWVWPWAGAGARPTYVRLTGAPGRLCEAGAAPDADTPEPSSAEAGASMVFPTERATPKWPGLTEDWTGQRKKLSHARTTRAQSRARRERGALTRRSAGPRAPRTARRRSCRVGQSQ